MTQTKKPIRFTKICAGLYFNAKWDMVISHEAVWRKDEGRKWVTKWKVAFGPGLMPRERNMKFDYMKDARNHLRELAARAG
jgi:hypothetical protein